MFDGFDAEEQGVETLAAFEVGVHVPVGCCLGCTWCSPNPPTAQSHLCTSEHE